MRCLDGPFAGAELSLRSCPTFLRVTRSTGGKFDALDQPEDVPGEREVVLAYRVVEGTWGQAFLCGRGRGQLGRYEWADYRVMDPQPAVEVLRDRGRWVEYVRVIVAREGL